MTNIDYNKNPKKNFTGPTVPLLLKSAKFKT